MEERMTELATKAVGALLRRSMILRLSAAHINKSVFRGPSPDRWRRMPLIIVRQNTIWFRNAIKPGYFRAPRVLTLEKSKKSAKSMDRPWSACR